MATSPHWNPIKSNPWATALADARRVGRLMRQRGDNPLVRTTSPRPSRKRRMEFALLWVLVAGAEVAWSVGLSNTGTPIRDIPYFLFTTGLFAAPLIPFLSFFAFGYRYRHPSHLEELRLTSLAPDEVAFGAVWWPVVFSFWLFLPLLLMQVGAEISCLVTRPESPVMHGSRLALLPVAWATATAIVARYWFRHGKSVKTLILSALDFALLAVVLFGVSWIWGVLLNQSTFFHGPDTAAAMSVAIVVAPVVGWIRIRRAFRFAGAAFFSPLDPEPLAAVDWVANEMLRFKEKEERRETLRRLFRAARPGGPADRWAWFITGLLLVGGWSVGAGFHDSIGLIGGLRGVLGVNSLAAALLYATGLSVLARAYGARDTRVPLVSGTVIGSLLPYLAIPFSGVAVLLAISFLIEMTGIRASTQNWIAMGIATGFVLIAYLLSAFIVVVALLPRGRRVYLGAGFLTVAALLHCIPLIDMSDYPGDPAVLYFRLGSAGEYYYVLVLPLLPLLTVVGLPGLAQRLHDREFRGIPRHRITTEEADPADRTGLTELTGLTRQTDPPDPTDPTDPTEAPDPTDPTNPHEPRPIGDPRP